MENELFTAVVAAIRTYVIRRLAEQVANDVIANGLRDEDMTVINGVMNAPATTPAEGGE